MQSGWIDRDEDWNKRGSPERPGSWAFQLALSLLGPLFFLSYLFSLLAPLPLLYLHVGTASATRGRRWASGAVLLGLLLCFAVKGWLWGSLLFLLFAALPALVLGELLLRQFGPEKAVAGAVVAVTVASLLSAWGVAHQKGIELLPSAKQMTEKFIHDTADRLLSQEKGDLSEETKESLKKIRGAPAAELITLPGMMLFAILLLCALPCVALIRWNPKGFLRRAGISRDFLRKWSAPEWLVWPSLLCGALHLYEVSPFTEIARNALIPILLIYFFHGMSILAYFLDSMRLRGPFRVLFYGTAILFLTPMVVSFGFFDLWFGFRTRNRGADAGDDKDKDTKGDQGKGL